MRILTVLLAVVAISGPVWAETNAEKGLRIAQEATERRDGYQDISVTGEMILTSKSGKTSTRKFDSSWVDVPEGGARSLLIFRWPGDIRNTALLTHANYNKKDDQWLYLPSLEKVRRISSSGRSGAFVGSEFAFEDMVDQEIDKFDHMYVSEEPCPNGGTCHVIDRVPRGKSGYSSQRVWFDVTHLRLQQVKYFDRRKAHLKTLTFAGYKLYLGEFWRAHEMNMVNHLSGKSTLLTWGDYAFNSGLRESKFTVNALKRIR